MSDSEYSTDEPLTKPKLVRQPAQTDVNESISVQKSRPQAELNQKPKKPRSEAQKIAFEKARLKRLSNYAAKREAKQIEDGKKYVQTICSDIETDDEIVAEPKQTFKKGLDQKRLPKKKKKVVYIESSSESESESESEEETIIIKRPKKKSTKKIKQPIALVRRNYNSDVETDSDDDDYTPIQRNFCMFV